MKQSITLDKLTPDHVSALSEEDLITLVYTSLDAFCMLLEEKGIQGDYIDPVLLGLFSMRMSEDASRDEFEDMLQDAIDEPWEDSDWYNPPSFH
jgi:hypothetical protein